MANTKNGASAPMMKHLKSLTYIETRRVRIGAPMISLVTARGAKMSSRNYLSFNSFFINFLKEQIGLPKSGHMDILVSPYPKDGFQIVFNPPKGITEEIFSGNFTTSNAMVVNSTGLIESLFAHLKIPLNDYVHMNCPFEVSMNNGKTLVVQCKKGKIQNSIRYPSKTRKARKKTTVSK